MTLVRVEHLAVHHHDAPAPLPQDVTFELWTGEVLLVLGPSGCGKSTLTLTLNGLIPHSLPARLAGTVRVGGVDTTEVDVARLATDVGMVFQDPDAQIVTATVFDEVCFGCENLRLPVDDVEARATAALGVVGLADRADEDPANLSGGGRQRLALACALAMRPRVLVLDEPSANLDPTGTRELYQTLAKVVTEPMRAVVLVEHDLDDAVEIVDRVLVLDEQGRRVVCGPAREVFGTHAETLEQLGVWVPTAVRVARRLATAGVRLEPTPLGCAEAGRQLAELPHLPPPTNPPRRAHEEHATTAAMVTVDGLTVRRGSRIVLRDVSLKVPEGDFLAVVGANGAGKTTLGQAMAGVTPPPRGTVVAAGLDVGEAAPAQLATRIGFVFQNPEHQFMTGSVADELAVGLRLRKLPAADVDHRVEEYLHRFRLTAHRDRNPFLLSHGQKRRLSVASALIVGPGVLVLDEPTFGQDSTGASQLLTVLDDLNAAGTTVVVITHDLQLVADHANSVAVLADGRLLGAGATDDILLDDALLTAARLPPPPVRRIAESAARRHPAWDRVLRFAELPCE